MKHFCNYISSAKISQKCHQLYRYISRTALYIAVNSYDERDLGVTSLALVLLIKYYSEFCKYKLIFYFYNYIRLVFVSIHARLRQILHVSGMCHILIIPSTKRGMTQSSHSILLTRSSVNFTDLVRQLTESRRATERGSAPACMVFLTSTHL